MTREAELSTGTLIGSSASSLAAVVATWLSSILLSGLLTVVVGRAVFGAGITIGEAWQRLRGRLWALIGFTVLWGLIGAVLLVGVVVGHHHRGRVRRQRGSCGRRRDPAWVAAIVGLVYLWTMLSFAPSIIVLERLDIVPAIKRSFKLVRNDFWRVFGIRLLGMIVAELIAGAVAVPFSFGGQILLMTASSTAVALIALVLLTIGGAIGQIITAPFSAGVVVLLYTDRRIRAEAFDLVLQTGAAFGPGAPPDSTDHLWLTRHNPDVPTIDIDRDAAHEAAQHELAKPIYPKASLTERLIDWIDELLYRLIVEGSSVPGGWFTISVLLILLAVAVVVAVRIARRTMRTNRGGGYALFGEHELSAAEHRATAEQCCSGG